MTMVLAEKRNKIENVREWVLIFICWLIASVSTLGSLFLSEVMLFPPCVLCWYQRICMYPLVLIFLGGLTSFDKSEKSDKSVFKFSFPLICVGWMIAFYHNLLYYEILPESAAPCAQGISCTTVFINWWGFLTIPLLSWISFSLLLVLLMIYKKSFQKN